MSAEDPGFMPFSASSLSKVFMAFIQLLSFIKHSFNTSRAHFETWKAVL
jgi:hypothetical protein